MTTPMHSRRSFLKQSLKTAAAAAGAPLILPSRVLGQGHRPSPSNRLTMAIIGCGNQGSGELGNWLGDERVQVVAVCDPNLESGGYWAGRTGGRGPAQRRVEAHYANQTRSGAYAGCDSYVDFRDIVARDDIDCAYVGTPDHWHAILAIELARTGKDIYGQKPLSLTIPEGRAMVRAVERYGSVWQTGSQQRSDARMRRACELVRNGAIGRLKHVRVGLLGGTPDVGKTGAYTTPEPVPEGFDYNLWLGPAPWAPHCRARTHVNWRWILDYSGGQLTDWGAHHIDIAHWGMGAEDTGPIAIENARGTYGTGLWNTARDFSFDAIYADGVRLTVSNRERGGVAFEGEDGTIHTNRGHISADRPEILQATIPPTGIHLYRSNHHFRNFIDCVVSRRRTAAPIAVAHRSVSVAHLGNLAMRTTGKLRWDPEQEQVLGNPAAAALLKRAYREPWILNA